MALPLILLPLLAQVGPGPALPQAPLEIKRKPDKVIDTPALPPSRLTQCLTLARSEWARMKAADSRECRNCHGFESMDPEKQKQRARKQLPELGELLLPT